MSYCGSEVWAGDNKGMLHSFSMQAGTLKPLSRFDVGHTAVVTGIHNSPGALYTCSSDCTVKVKTLTFSPFYPILLQNNNLHKFCDAGPHSLCPPKDIMYTAPPSWSQWG